MPQIRDHLPIGVFDSGVGGLTVLRSLALHFPREDFLYLGDNARLPYGTKSPQTIRKYSEQAINYLVQVGVKAVIIACSSASSQFRETEYQSTTHKFPIPVENVINPAICNALKFIQTEGNIGVIGTSATIESKVYEEGLLREAQKRNLKIKVFSTAAPLLVPLAEEGWIDDPITNLIVYRYLEPFMATKLDALILGCTHYPILRNSIQKVIGSNTALVESGDSVVESLQRQMDLGIIQARKEIHFHEERKIFLLATETSYSFISMAYGLLGEERISSFQTVDLSF